MNGYKAESAGPGLQANSTPPSGIGLIERATEAAAFLKALSHEGRLVILCHLAMGERTVSQLEQLLGARQAAVSQQLARLRLEGLVTTRRDGKAIYYTILDNKVLQTIELLHRLYPSGS